MKLMTLLLLICLPQMSLAKDGLPVSKALAERAMDIVAKLIKSDFHQLKGKTITVKGMHSVEVFLATDIVIPSLLMGEREYILYLNNRLLESPISDIALQGILAHELSHMSDYENMNLLELAIFHGRYLIDGEFVAAYERATDLQTFQLGYAIGVKAFRYWLYEQITPHVKVNKEKNYYSPIQIDDWILDQVEVTVL